MVPNFTIPCIGFLLTLVFGSWLSRLGKPYNGILFNIHKLIALGTVIYFGWQLSRWLNGTTAPTGFTILLILAVLCIILIFASGGLLSAEKLDYFLLLTVHRIMPLVLTIALILGAIILLKIGLGSFPG